MVRVPTLFSARTPSSDRRLAETCTSEDSITRSDDCQAAKAERASETTARSTCVTRSIAELSTACARRTCAAGPPPWNSGTDSCRPAVTDAPSGEMRMPLMSGIELRTVE